MLKYTSDFAKIRLKIQMKYNCRIQETKHETKSELEKENAASSRLVLQA